MAKLPASMMPAVLALILTAAGCGAPERDAESPSIQDGGVTPAAYEACVAADNASNEAWRMAIDGRGPGDFSNEEFNQRLRDMIDACRPILPMFEGQPDSAVDQVSAICASGYREKIEAYELLLSGVAGDAGANKLLKGTDLLRQCDERAAELQKLISTNR